MKLFKVLFFVCAAVLIAALCLSCPDNENNNNNNGKDDGSDLPITNFWLSLQSPVYLSMSSTAGALLQHYIDPYNADQQAEYVVANTNVAVYYEAGRSLRPVAPGNTTVTVTTKGKNAAGEQLSITLDIIVGRAGAIAAVSLPESYSVYNGLSGFLNVGIIPEGNTNYTDIQWSSSNPAVAAVEKETIPATGVRAKVTGMSSGAAVITVKVLTAADGEFTASTNVTVTELPVWSNEHTLVVRNLAVNPDRDTTPDNAAFITWTGDTYSSQFQVVNAQSTAAVGDSNSTQYKPADSTIVYHKMPISGPFTQKMKISSVSHGDTGGLLFGIFYNPTEEGSPSLSGTPFIHFAGIRFANAGAVRAFHSNPGGSQMNSASVSSIPESTLVVDPAREYTFAVSWDGTRYQLQITGDGINGSANINASSVSNLMRDVKYPMYAGFLAANATVIVKEYTISRLLDLSVSGVSLDKTSLQMVKGDTNQLTAGITPTGAANKNLIWTASNPSAANVDQNGLVTATGEGQSIITVRTEDGNYTASCTVNSTNDPIAVASLTLSDTNIEVFFNAQPLLTATLLPANATYKGIIWTSSNESAVTVNNSGRLKAVGVGTAVITAETEGKTVSGQSLTSSCAVTVGETGVLFEWDAETDTDFADIGQNTARKIKGVSFFAFEHMIPAAESINGDMGYHLKEGVSACLQIGSTSTLRTTNASSPIGELDLSQPYRVIVTYTLVTAQLRLGVNNNTGTGGNSPLGGGSLVNIGGSILGEKRTYTGNLSLGNNDPTGMNAFITLRAAGSTGTDEAIIHSIRVERVTE